MIASLGGPDELGLALELALSEKTPAAQRAILLDTLAQAHRQRQVKPKGDLGRLATLLDVNDESVKAAAARAIGVWKVMAAQPKVQALAQAKDAAMAVRLGAVDGLAALNDPASRAILEEIGAAKDSSIRGAAIVALSAINLDQSAELASAYLTDANPDASTAIFEAFAGRKGGQIALARELSNKTIASDVAKLGLRLNGTSGRPEPKLVEALTKAGKLAEASKPPTGPERDKLIADVHKIGDAKRGEAVFRRDAMQCLKCHAIAGAGGQVGPGWSRSAGVLRSIISWIRCSNRPRQSRKTIMRRSSPRVTARL